MFEEKFTHMIGCPLCPLCDLNGFSSGSKNPDWKCGVWNRRGTGIVVMTAEVVLWLSS